MGTIYETKCEWEVDRYYPDTRCKWLHVHELTIAETLFIMLFLQGGPHITTSAHFLMLNK